MPRPQSLLASHTHEGPHAITCQSIPHHRKLHSHRLSCSGKGSTMHLRCFILHYKIAVGTCMEAWMALGDGQELVLRFGAVFSSVAMVGQ